LRNDLSGGGKNWTPRKKLKGGGKKEGEEGEKAAKKEASKTRSPEKTSSFESDTLKRKKGGKEMQGERGGGEGGPGRKTEGKDMGKSRTG